MNKNNIILILLLVIVVGITAFFFTKNNSLKTTSNDTGFNSVSNSDTGTNSGDQVSNQDYMLKGYPVDQVPFYKMSEISSIKFFVNDDTSSEYLYDGPVNYYNVVYETTAPRSEVFEYYRSILSDIDPEEISDSKLVGKVGTYRVYIGQYAEDAENVSMQIALPTAEFEKTNPFFEEYPQEIIEIDPSWIEKESSYGLLNQKGGEIEYTRYYIMNENQLPTEAGSDPLKYYFEKYSELYLAKTDFTKDSEQQLLKWQDGEYEVSASFSTDHGRVYLMIRKLIN